MNENDQRAFVDVFQKEVPRDGVAGRLFRPTTTYMRAIIVMVFSFAVSMLALWAFLPKFDLMFCFFLSLFGVVFGLIGLRLCMTIGVDRDAKIMAKISKEKYFDKLIQKYNLSYTGLSEKEILKSVKMFFINGREGHFVVRDNMTGELISLVNNINLDYMSEDKGNKNSNTSAFVGLEDYNTHVDNLEPLMFVQRLQAK